MSKVSENLITNDEPFSPLWVSGGKLLGQGSLGFAPPRMILDQARLPAPLAKFRDSFAELNFCLSGVALGTHSPSNMNWVVAFSHGRPSSAASIPLATR
jgi:hypothetical protein